MLESQIDQEERKRVLDNDRRVREQTGTYLSHTHSDLGGRWAAIQRETVVGRPSTNEPPPLPPTSPWAGPDPVPDEPALGYPIDQVERD